jgi:hypothetical protein
MTPNRRLESIQEWSAFMKKSSTWNFKSIVPINGISALGKIFSAGKKHKIFSNLLMGKIVLGLVIAFMIGSISVVPAIGKDDHKNMGKHDNGRYEHRGRGYDHNYRPYGYYGHRERVYYPAPPVVWAPPPPPGIGIFFPPVFIRP